MTEVAQALRMLADEATPSSVFGGTRSASCNGRISREMWTLAWAAVCVGEGLSIFPARFLFRLVGQMAQGIRRATAVQTKAGDWLLILHTFQFSRATTRPFGAEHRFQVREDLRHKHQRSPIGTTCLAREVRFLPHLSCICLGARLRPRNAIHS